MTQPLPFGLPISFIFDDEGVFLDLEGEFLERVRDHCAQGISHFIEQYKEKPRLAELLCIYLDQVQEAENAAWRCATERAVDTAIGAQLTQLGAIIGQPRLGLSDDNYRPLIRARVRANRSEGTPPDLYKVVRAAMGVESGSGRYDPYPPASLIFWVGAPLAFSHSILHGLLIDSVMAGVRIISVFLTADPSAMLTLGWSGNAPESSAMQGLGWTGNALGGVLAHALG